MLCHADTAVPSPSSALNNPLSQVHKVLDTTILLFFESLSIDYNNSTPESACTTAIKKRKPARHILSREIIIKKMLFRNVDERETTNRSKYTRPESTKYSHTTGHAPLFWLLAATLHKSLQMLTKEESLARTATDTNLRV